MINTCDSPHLIVDPSRASGTGCDLHFWQEAIFFPPPLWWLDGSRDLQANDAEKLLSMWREWRGQVWLDCPCKKTAVYCLLFGYFGWKDFPHTYSHTCLCMLMLIDSSLVMFASALMSLQVRWNRGHLTARTSVTSEVCLSDVFDD